MNIKKTNKRAMAAMIALPLMAQATVMPVANAADSNAGNTMVKPGISVKVEGSEKDVALKLTNSSGDKIDSGVAGKGENASLDLDGVNALGENLKLAVEADEGLEISQAHCVVKKVEKKTVPVVDSGNTDSVAGAGEEAIGGGNSANETNTPSTTEASNDEDGNASDSNESDGADSTTTAPSNDSEAEDGNADNGSGDNATTSPEAGDNEDGSPASDGEVETKNFDWINATADQRVAEMLEILNTQYHTNFTMENISEDEEKALAETLSNAEVVQRLANGSAFNDNEAELGIAAGILNTPAAKELIKSIPVLPQLLETVLNLPLVGGALNIVANLAKQPALAGMAAAAATAAGVPVDASDIVAVANLVQDFIKDNEANKDKDKDVDKDKDSDANKDEGKTSTPKKDDSNKGDNKDKDNGGVVTATQKVPGNNSGTPVNTVVDITMEDLKADISDDKASISMTASNQDEIDCTVTLKEKTDEDKDKDADKDKTSSSATSNPSSSTVKSSTATPSTSQTPAAQFAAKVSTGPKVDTGGSVEKGFFDKIKEFFNSFSS